MDYDVAAVALSTPPAIAPMTTYRPAIAVLNLGRFSAIATGSISGYRAGLRVYYSQVTSEPIAPGETGLAIAADDWLPTEQGDHIFFGNVTTYRDQNQSNGNLPPTTVTVGPPPPPPTPATLDDVVAALDTLGTEQTLQDIAASVPAAPATEPTLAQVRDEVTTAAKEATLQAVGDAIGDTAKEVTLLDANSKLAAGLPTELAESGGLKVEPTGTIITTPSTPKNLESLGTLEVGLSPVLLAFSGTTRTISITAHPDNTGLVYVGLSGVTSQGENALTLLQAGDSLAIDYDDELDDIHLCASEQSQHVVAGATVEPE